MSAGEPVLLMIYDLLLDKNYFAQGSHGMLKTISADHARVHEGVAFNFSEIVNPVAAAGMLSYLIQVNSYETHLRSYNFTSTVGPAPIVLYENPFTDAASLGSSVSAVNLDRDSVNTPSTTLRKNPFSNPNSIGLLLDANLIESSAGGPIKAVGGESGAPVIEWDLNVGQNYLLTFVNSNSGDAIVAPKIAWYEEGRND